MYHSVKTKTIASKTRPNRVIKQLKMEKTPGLDSIIYNEIITETYYQLEEPMINLTRASFSVNYIPKSWTGTGSVIIVKPGKKSTQKHDHSELSVYLKVME